MKMAMLQQLENLEHTCRICLTKNKVLILITNYLYNGESSLSPNPLISNALSDIMSEEIDNNHPKGICLLCLKGLKLAYNLKLQFKKSQQILRNYEELLIESYKKDDLFEVYDSDVGFNHDPDDNFKNNSATEEQTKITIPKYFINSPSRVINDEQQTMEFSELSNIKQEDFTGPTKIVKLENRNKSRYDVQVRCIEANKFVIEKKMNTFNKWNPNLEHLQHDLSSSKAFILDKDVGNEGSSDEIDFIQIKCPSCEQHYSKAKLEEHVLTCNLNTSSFKCNECDKVFRKIKNLNSHMGLKHSMNPFPCKICGLVYDTYNAKQKHIREKHGAGKSFKCDICNKGFYFNAGLLKHKSVHTRETQEVCNICGKTFHYKGALFYHIKIHTNERKYLCIYCGRNFYTSQSLQRHVDTHTGVRRFKCNFCDKSLRSSSERRRHEMIHTGERPHQCDYCDKGFTSKYNLNVHIAAHRGKHECIFCTGKFLNKEVLQLHMKFKHRV